MLLLLRRLAAPPPQHPLIRLLPLAPSLLITPLRLRECEFGPQARVVAREFSSERKRHKRCRCLSSSVREPYERRILPLQGVTSRHVMQVEQGDAGTDSCCLPQSISNVDAKNLNASASVSEIDVQASSIAQYVVIRKDLLDSLNWPLGSVITQACHAAVAAVWLHKDHSDTLEYCENLDNMTTVTLEVKGEVQLLNLAQKLEAGGIDYKLWIEQPEKFPTCLATKPYPKAEVAKYFKKLKLCK